MKNFVLLFLSLFSLSCFAATNHFNAPLASCPQALATDDQNFCASFRDAAECYCRANRMPRNACNRMRDIYARMISALGSLEKACAFQKNTETKNCINDWNCYFNGGTDSTGKICSGTGEACE